MSGQEKPAEQNTEQRSDTKTATPEKAVKEAEEGKEGLVTGIKKALETLKAGGKSGITNEFGKPLILDQLGLTAGKAADAAAKPMTVSGGEIPAIISRITGEVRIPASIQKLVDERTQAGQGAEAQHKVGGLPDLKVGEHPDILKPGAPQKDDAPKEHEQAEKVGGAHAEKGGRHHGDGVVHMEPLTITTPYTGERINRDVDPSTHNVQAGETLSRIAREHLGKDATEEEVAAHVKEIAKVNHLNNPNRLHAGQELVLPGHTKDGGFVLNDHADNKLTRWADGTERAENSNGTGYVRKQTADGGSTEHHWGPRPENNYEATHTPDGKLLFAAKPGDKPEEHYPSEAVRKEREHLEQSAQEKIKNPQELAQFRANMSEFEERAHRQGLPPEEIEKTYKELSKLMDSRGNDHVNHKDRIVLAEQVMDQVAHPTSIDQGQHSTCNVTTVESRTYTRHPSEAARMITEVATTGNYTTHDGKHIHVPSASLHKDTEAVGNPPGYGDRSYASQVFQVTAVNTEYQTHGHTYTDSHGREHHVGPGALRYEQRSHPVPPDTGERLYDITTHPPRLVAKAPDLNDDDIVRINNKITGESGKDMYIDHVEDVCGDANGVTTIKDEKEFNDRLKAAADAKPPNFPLIIRVETGNEPFLHDSGAGAAGGSGGAHVITVTGYEAGPPSRVHVDNQWGENVDYQGDKFMSVHDLYMTMRPPDNANQIKDLQKDVDHDRANNTIDTRKEFELLRLRHNLPATDANHLNDADYNRMVKEQVDAASKRWEEQGKKGTFNQAEHDNAMVKLMEMERNQPQDVRLGWIESMHKGGMLKDAEYDFELTKSIQDSKARWAEEDAAKPPKTNATERNKSKDELKRLLDELPADRRQAIIDNVTK